MKRRVEEKEGREEKVQPYARESFLRGKILPSNCLYIAMAEEAYNLKEHVEESNDNLVFFFPLGNDELRAVCVTRGELQQYTKVFYRCMRECLGATVDALRAVALQDEAYYQLLVAEFPIYITEENFQV